MDRKKVSALGLSAMKASGEKISVLTAYDYPTGRLVNEAGIDVALVGDSLGRVVLGFDNELSVTMEDMIRHAAAVVRGTEQTMVVVDMPFMSYQVSDDEAVRNAGRLIVESGAQAVKLEGPRTGAIRKIVDAGIPVFGHIGLTPQSVNAIGLRIQGKDAENAERIRREALAIQEAGACAIVLEAIPSDLAESITQSLDVPTIGIGAGPYCDGFVLVVHDILNMYEKLKPSFVKQYADVWQVTLEAFKAYNQDIKEGKFPEKK